MTFAPDALDRAALRERMAAATAAEVRALLRRDRVADADLPLLLSPAAGEMLEELAQRAAAITAHRFGRTVVLYAPLYLSNACVNDCAYCGFARSNRVARRSLAPEEAEREAELLHEQGFRHLLLVSGEARQACGVGDLEEVARRLAGRFASIGVEAFPMEAGEYRRMAAAGVDALTLYQETYDREVYARVHRAGPKADYDRRLAAIEAGGEAGLRTLGIGALLGLAPWREEALALAMHGRFLARRFWRSRVAVSFPRLRPAAGGFVPPHPVSDRELAQVVAAMRLALPDADLVLSTREPAALRDGLIRLGITRMSAGSRTSPGGYGEPEAAGEQFAVHDPRSPAEVAAAITAAGREPVWKDFDPALREVTR